MVTWTRRKKTKGDCLDGNTLRLENTGTGRGAPQDRIYADTDVQWNFMTSLTWEEDLRVWAASVSLALSNVQNLDGNCGRIEQCLLFAYGLYGEGNFLECETGVYFHVSHRVPSCETEHLRHSFRNSSNVLALRMTLAMMTRSCGRMPKSWRSVATRATTASAWYVYELGQRRGGTKMGRRGGDGSQYRPQRRHHTARRRSPPRPRCRASHFPTRGRSS